MKTPIEPAHVIRKLRGQPTSDGAGVSLTRVIGSPELDMLDPFLLFDEFGTDRSEDYIGGFPDHPHRGFETVTYMLDGRMRHKDNHGNEGLLVPGSVQWMTAGRGLVHSEMPEQQEGRMRGFQLWVNLPASAKMTEPRYQEFGPDDIPAVPVARGVTVKAIAGEVAEEGGNLVRGPIVQPATSPLYFDVALDPGAQWSYVLAEGHNAFVYVFDGRATIGEGEDGRILEQQELGVLGGGASVGMRGGSDGARLILVAGRPLREPVARYGPFVMNTREQVMQAFVDFQEGRL